MASYVPCKKNDSNGNIFYVSLPSQANGKIMQANPTIVAADVNIAKDDGAPVALNTTPAVDADFTKRVKVTLSQAETNADNITIIFSDAAGSEWCDLFINIQTSTQTLDEMDTVADGIKSVTDLLPNSGALSDLATILTAIQHATYGLSAIETLVDELESRLTAARAGYLDELAAANLPTDIDLLVARLTAARAGYLDNLSAGAVALEATLTAIKGATWSIETLEAIYDKIGAASPANFTPATSSTVTHGTETNAYTDCATDNGTRWQAVDPEDTNPIEVLCKFALGTTHSATGLTINGYFNRDGGIAIVEIYAYNYTTSTWDKLSAGTVSTEMRDSAVDKDYSFSLSYGHTKTTATVGEVQIKFLSTVAHAVDVLHLDYVAIEGQPTGAIDPDTIASAVWTHSDGHDVSRHIPKYVGHVWYVDTAGDDANEGLTVHEALATLAEAISQGSAGDRVVMKAGSYTEAGTDLSKAGMEIHAEYGTIMTGGGGTGLVVSGNNCKIENLWTTPAAGQIGFDITGNHGRFINCESYSSGATGFRTGTAAGQTHFTNCSSRKYTTAGFELQGAAATLIDCQAMTQHGSSTIGFHLSNAVADRCSLIRCNSINNGTNSFLDVSGADENLFVDCADSDTCGAVSDSGTNNAWRNYRDSDIVAADAPTVEEIEAELATEHGEGSWEGETAIEFEED